VRVSGQRLDGDRPGDRQCDIKFSGGYPRRVRESLMSHAKPLLGSKVTTMSIKTYVGAMLIAITLGTGIARAQNQGPALSPGQAIVGQLHVASGLIPQNFPMLKGYPFQLHRLEIRTPADYTIDMRSAGNNPMPDPYLLLLNDRGQLLAHDDDGGEGLNARLRVRLAAGTYFLVASTYERDGFGQYRIDVSHGRMNATGSGTQGNAARDPNGARDANGNPVANALAPVDVHERTRWTDNSPQGRLTFEFSHDRHNVRVSDGQQSYNGTYRQNGYSVVITVNQRLADGRVVTIVYDGLMETHSDNTVSLVGRKTTRTPAASSGEIELIGVQHGQVGGGSQPRIDTRNFRVYLTDR
jgi:hypothetical protein